MDDLSMNLKSKSEEQRAFFGRMGISYQNGLDVLKREDFDSDDAYIDALVEREMKMDNARYQEIRRQYVKELERKREAKLAKQKEQHYKKIRETVKLSPDEEQRLTEKATAAASADLYAQRIQPKEFDAQKQKYFKEYEKKELRNKASGQIFNEWWRSETSRNLLDPETGELVNPDA